MFETRKQMNQLKKLKKEFEAQVNEEMEVLSQKKKALKEEEQRIKEEQNKLEAMRAIFESKMESIPSFNLYILHVREWNHKYIVKYSEQGVHNYTNVLNPDMVFKNSGIWRTEDSIFSIGKEDIHGILTPIHKYSHSCIYANGKIPKLRLLELYYEMNGITNKNLQEEAKKLLKK